LSEVLERFYLEECYRKGRDYDLDTNVIITKNQLLSGSSCPGKVLLNVVCFRLSSVYPSNQEAPIKCLALCNRTLSIFFRFKRSVESPMIHYKHDDLVYLEDLDWIIDKVASEESQVIVVITVVI
jgi:hypothetical protein